MDIKTLIRRLETAEAKDPKDGFTMEILWGDYRKNKMREIVTEWAAEQTEGKDGAEQAKRIAELEAKVYAYEKIIANSNFQPLVAPKTLPIPYPESPQKIYEPFFKPPYEVTCEEGE